MGELDRTWAIDERIGLVHEAGGGDRELDTHLVVAGFLAAVADGGASVHGALALDRAGAGEDRFEKCGFAALERAHQRDAPGTRRSCAVLCHVPLPAALRRGLVGTLVAGMSIVSGPR